MKFSTLEQSLVAMAYLHGKEIMGRYKKLKKMFINLKKIKNQEKYKFLSLEPKSNGHFFSVINQSFSFNLKVLFEQNYEILLLIST